MIMKDITSGCIFRFKSKHACLVEIVIIFKPSQVEIYENSKEDSRNCIEFRSGFTSQINASNIGFHIIVDYSFQIANNIIQYDII